MLFTVLTETTHYMATLRITRDTFQLGYKTCNLLTSWQILHGEEPVALHRKYKTGDTFFRDRIGHLFLTWPKLRLFFFVSAEVLKHFMCSVNLKAW